MANNRKILVVAAHPDDEILGCGGSMALHASQGDEVHVMFLTDGVGSRGADRDREAGARATAAFAACSRVGALPPLLGCFPDNQLDTLPLLSVAQAIESVAARVSPDIVYTHHRGDLNIDHRIAHEAVMICFRPQPAQPRPLILAFETPSSTEWASPGVDRAFVPNWFVDITETLETKFDALRIYHIEMRAWPHTRSLEAIEHLCRWRGACVGLAAAEAFTVVRRIGIA